MALVSVIIPTYNNVQQLKRAVISVFSQSYTNVEVIVVDDGSTEDYSNVIARLETEAPFPFYYYKKVNAGPGLARQFGLEKSSGNYIQYLDSDDELLSHKVELQAQILSDNPNIAMTYGLSMVNNDVSNIHRKKVHRNFKDDLLNNVLQVRKWHTSSCLWNYSISQNVYWEKLFNGEDVLHDFNVALNFKREVIFVNEVLVNLNISHGPTQLSSVGREKKLHRRLISDIMYLNSEMYERLKRKNLLQKKIYREPLAERMFHAAMRISLMEDKNESLKMVCLSQRTTRSLIKKLELFILKILVRLNLKRRRKSYQIFYKIRRRVLSQNTHLYRNV
jgi:glycosyltransferase involved in cell wall biosynthesis